MDQEALGCAAYLTGIVHAAPDHFFYSQIDISILENDEGIISAKFKGNVRKVRCASLVSLDAYFGRACQSDSVNVWIFAKPGSCFAASAGNDLDSARKYAGLAEHLCQHAKCQRIVGRWFYDRCVSCEKCRCYLLIKQVAREVERNDTCDDSDRLLFGDQNMLILSRLEAGRESIAIEVFCLFAKTAESDPDVADLCSRFNDRFARLLRKCLSEFFLVIIYDIEELVHYLNFLGYRYLCPDFLCFFCTCYSSVDIFLGSCRDRVDHFSGCGIDHVYCRTV